MKKIKKLQVNRQSIRNLSGRDLDAVAGGDSSDCLSAGCTRINCPDPTPTGTCTTVGGPTDICTRLGCR